MQNPIKKLYEWILNIPFIWNTIQYLLGANSFKYKMYPSVFKTRKGTLLDFGCSCGNITDVFLDFDYYGVDMDKDAIEFARRRFAGYENVRFQVADLIAGPFKESFFDHVLFAGTAHHISPQQLVVITKNLLASLKPGGELHVFEPFRQEKDRWITKWILDHDQGKYMRTRDELLDVFGGNGYQIVESKIFPSPLRPIKLPDLLYLRILK